MSKLIPAVREVAKDAARVSWMLFRIMIPVLILVKILEVTGGITIIGNALQPVMQLVGLPGEMGIVWATALMTNLYAAALVFIALVPDHSMTVAQVTILATMMSIAHDLPVETSIVRKAGMRITPVIIFRLGVAILYAFLLHFFTDHFNWLQGEATIHWVDQPAEPTIIGWALLQAKNLLMIFGIITTLMLIMRFLYYLNIVRWIEWLFRPLFKRVGIGPQATTVTVIGLLLGVTYGSGFIIREARSGHLPVRDVFLSICVIALCHSIVEDTLMMMLLGANVFALLGGRLFMSFALAWILWKIIPNLNDEQFSRYCCRRISE